MKSKLSCLILSLFCLCSYSQEIDVTNVFKITAINPGLSWENRIGKLQTIYVQGFINLTSFYGDEPNSFKITPDPAVTLHYRYYFNGPIRKNNGKRIEMNSMNYVAFVSELVSSRAPISKEYYEEKERRPITSLGFCWGMQRNY